MAMLLPARTKYAKVQKGRIYGNAKGGAELAFGTFGIQVLEITRKPAETRMGKGKGSVEYWVTIVKPGMILFEVTGVSLAIAQEAMALADRKLGLRCRFVNQEALTQRF